MCSRAEVVNKNVNVHRLPVAALNAGSKMADIVMLEKFIEDVCQIAVKQDGFTINSRKPFKFILFSNFQALKSISKFTLPARTKPHFFSQKFTPKFPYSYGLFYSLNGLIK